jgi:hypothetical protein
MKFKSAFADWNTLFVAQQGARRKSADLGKAGMIYQLIAFSY